HNLEITGPRIDAYGRGYGFAVKEGDFALRAQLNQGLAITKNNGHYDEIYEKWFGVVDPKGLTNDQIFRYMSWAASAIAVLVTLSIAWSFSLRRQVELKTASLAAEIKEREKAEKALSAHHRSLIRLQRLTSSSDLNFDEKVHALLELGREVFDMPLGIVSQIEGESYTIKYVLGPDWAPPHGTVFELGDTYCVHTLQSDVPTAYDNAGKSEICDHPCYKGFGLESYIGAKLMIGNKLYGTLNFSSPDVHPAKFSQAEIALIRLFADWISNELQRHEAQEAIVQAKADAEDANRAKSEFLSSMSHELRTPLNSILGFAQVLEMSTRTPLTEEQKKSTAQIRKGGEHLLDLINDVLNLARIETGRLDISIEPIDTKNLVSECIIVADSLSHTKDVRIIADDFPSAVVMADRVRFKQVLLNLMSNAVKYNREGGTVTLTSALIDDARQRISVADTGYGIPQDKQSELFIPFTRLGLEGSGIEGTGIGLTITQRLIQAMGGTIGFESTEGIGSKFWVDLPLATSQQATRTTRSQNVNTPVPEGVGKVLYIEDNPANIDLIETILDAIPGIVCSSTHTAELGLAAAKQDRPDLILMDINLPGMNGIEALAELKRHDETRDITVIALSAAAMPGEIKEGKKAGFYDYLTKPINVTELTQAVTNALSQRDL
ncbi:ATP-binding protein, partial [Pseudomonadota bacterium]